MTQKNVISTALVLALLLISSSGYAIGYKVDIDTRNDTFINKGKMTAKTSSSGGVSSNVLALRARTPQVDIGTVTYTSRNNTYINEGEMEAIMNASGGAATQTVALEAY